MAIRIQDADWIPGAIGFSWLYEHKITALVDGVEIYQEKPSGGSLFHQLNPERVVIKTLNKDESLRCNVSPKEVRFTDFMQQLGSALKVEAEKPILLIRFFDPVFSSEVQVGEVQADQVHVTCVPKDNELVRDYFPDLPEIEYKP